MLYSRNIKVPGLENVCVPTGRGPLHNRSGNPLIQHTLAVRPTLLSDDSSERPLCALDMDSVSSSLSTDTKPLWGKGVGTRGSAPLASARN